MLIVNSVKFHEVVVKLWVRNPVTVFFTNFNRVCKRFLNLVDVLCNFIFTINSATNKSLTHWLTLADKFLKHYKENQEEIFWNSFFIKIFFNAILNNK